MKEDIFYKIVSNNIKRYRLKETNPTIFNELFKGSNLTDAEANRNYYHVMWEIENFYLFNDADTQADKNAKFAEYNNFIGASSTPYNATETTSINLWKLGSSKWLNDKITLTKNDFYIKKFGCKVIKLSFNGGFSCPNRINNGHGCIFCSGNYEFAGNKNKSLKIISLMNYLIKKLIHNK